MVVFPNAKINIGLNILERLPDGYHSLETIFYPIAINDVLEVIEAPQLTFTSSGLEIPGSHDSNLCLKALEALRKDFHIPNVHIHLHKHIPVGAGLGGGSSDAAYFIKLVNEKFGLGLSDTHMQHYCDKLGADCSFFIKSMPVFAYGIGNKFKDITLNLNSYYIVLVKPPVHVSTAEAYRRVEPKKVTASLQEVITKPVAEWKEWVKNDFELSIFNSHPVIQDVRTGLYRAGALYASMSGSGSSVYGIFEKKPDLTFLEKENEVFYGV